MADKEFLVDLEKGVIVEEEPKKEEEIADEQGGSDDEHGSSASNEDSDDGHQEDSAAGSEEEAAGTDAEREAIRERRRLERQQKKQAQREREDRLRRELQSERTAREQLENRLSVIERRATGMELSTLDQHIKQAADAYNYFKNQIAVASAAGDHAAMSDAIEKMNAARDRSAQLDNIKKGYQRQQKDPAPPLDPVIANHAQEWMDRNPWYDPDRKDQDSDLTAVLDERLAREGWNPRTKEYWDELDARLKKYLPHRYKQSYNSGSRSTVAPPRVPVGGSGKETGAGSNGSSNYRLSAERMSALREAGIEPGSKEFVDAVKRYRDYDKQHAA